MLQRLYAIVDAETCARRGVGPVDLAQQLFDGGVRLVQYRDKCNGPQKVLEVATAIRDVFAQGMFVLNDRADLAALLRCGVHVGQDDLSVADARVCVKDAMVGVSTHTLEQLDAALTGDADYIAVGPVFATATKADAAAEVGLELLRAARRLTHRPIVAIGGITLERAADVRAAGADSVAVIGGFFRVDMTVAEAARAYVAAIA